MRILSKPIHTIFHAPFGGGGGEDDGHVSTEPTPESVEFHKKFSASRPDINVLPKKEVAESESDKAAAEAGAVKKDEVIEEKKDETDRSAALHKGPGSNIKKILEDKRKAELERDEVRTRAEKFEKEEKPALEQKIATLEAQINEGGHSKAEREDLQKKLDAVEAKLVEREEVAGKESANLKQRLAFYDIQSDETFIEKYMRPIHNFYEEATDSFQKDEAKMVLLRKAQLANVSALQASTPEERMAQERERNTILTQITDSMDEFSRGQFTTAMNGYIRATKEHARALGEHEKTRADIIKSRDEEISKQRTNIFTQWTKHNDLVAATFDDDTKFDPEVADAIKELKLNPSEELEKFSGLVRKVITGNARMEESVDLLQRGRVYPALQAKIKGQAHIIEGLQKTLAKLRGTKPTGEAKDGKPEEKTTSKQEFQSKFSASRPGLRRS